MSFIVRDPLTRKPESIAFEFSIDRYAFSCLFTEKKSSDFKWPSSLSLLDPVKSSTKSEVMSTVKLPLQIKADSKLNFRLSLILSLSLQNDKSPERNFKDP